MFDVTIDLRDASYATFLLRHFTEIAILQSDALKETFQFYFLSCCISFWFDDVYLFETILEIFWTLFILFWCF